MQEAIHELMCASTLSKLENPMHQYMNEANVIKMLLHFWLDFGT
jgi:hypothetical protein